MKEKCYFVTDMNGVIHEKCPCCSANWLLAPYDKIDGLVCENHQVVSPNEYNENLCMSIYWDYAKQYYVLNKFFRNDKWLHQLCWVNGQCFYAVSEFLSLLWYTEYCIP